VPYLNRLQSRLFQSTYFSGENLLVCAPTGAGKTNVAMLAIAREIERASRPREVKVVYVAPMKALAQEIVAKFSKRLQSLGMSVRARGGGGAELTPPLCARQVRELTGDMQLTRAEMDQTQVIVTTPEKWDVITRKAGGDGTLSELVQLLIIDEVHLVGEDRGPVIECLVARTLRQVEQRQQMVRIVALSATLPNYTDVAAFLRVNPASGLFYFDSQFRPVPLEQTFCGVLLASETEDKSASLDAEPAKPPPAAVSSFKRRAQVDELMNQVACAKAVDAIKRGHQVMVFVHSRKDTSKTARAFLATAALDGSEAWFGPKARNAQPSHDRFQERAARWASSSAAAPPTPSLTHLLLCSCTGAVQVAQRGPSRAVRARPGDPPCGHGARGPVFDRGNVRGRGAVLPRVHRHARLG
jgi:activating signal cointegrator complex subunit 3